MIILTPTQANRVRGLAIPGHALAPVPLADGTFALPEEVLADPAYARFRAALDALPKRDLRVGRREDPRDMNSAIVDSDYEQDPIIRARNNYSQAWRTGEVIEVP